MLHACFSFKQTEGGYWQSLLVKRHWEMKTRLAGFCTTLVRRWARPGWIRMEQGSCRSVFCLQQPTTCLRDCSIVTQKRTQNQTQSQLRIGFSRESRGIEAVMKGQRAHNKHPKKHLPICQSLPLGFCSMLCLMFRQWPAPWAGPDPKRLVVRLGHVRLVFRWFHVDFSWLLQNMDWPAWPVWLVWHGLGFLGFN